MFINMGTPAPVGTGMACHQIGQRDGESDGLEYTTECNLQLNGKINMGTPRPVGTGMACHPIDQWDGENDGMEYTTECNTQLNTI